MSTTFSTDSTANATPLTLDSALSAQVHVLGDALRSKGWTVSSAESCTGGGVAFAFTSVAGSSDWFNQSWVTYSNDAKRSVLGVTEQTLKEYGAVSKQTVKEMAEGVRRNSGAQLVVTVSGIAGPGGGSADKPVGLVWFGLAQAGKPTRTVSRTFGDVGRERVRALTVEQALKLLIDALS